MIDQIKSISFGKGLQNETKINSNKNFAFKFNSQLFQIFDETYWDQNRKERKINLHTLIRIEFDKTERADDDIVVEVKDEKK